jgi:hypothetical protein
MPRPVIPPFKQVAALIQRSVKTVVVPAITREVEAEAARFQRTIRMQRFPAIRRIPLSPRWAAFKRRKGLDSRTLIATGHYVRNLRAVHVFDRRMRAHTWHVGAPAGMRARTPDNKTANITLQELAAVQEFGSRTVPARPHWRPFWTAANMRMRLAVLRANRAGVAFVNRALRQNRTRRR